jgi:type IV pilus assembly protein PilA
MKTIKTMIKDTKKKAFTLIELLIVVAIIGILAGVGIPMYNGYMANAKVESSNTNHSNNKSFIAATLTRCSSGSAKVSINNTDADCTEDKLKPAFIAYFKDINKNPYDATDATDATEASMLEGGGTPALGQSFLATAGKTYTLITNVGDADGGNVRKGPVVMTRE